MRQNLLIIIFATLMLSGCGGDQASESTENTTKELPTTSKMLVAPPSVPELK